MKAGRRAGRLVLYHTGSGQHCLAVGDRASGRPAWPVLHRYGLVWWGWAKSWVDPGQSRSQSQ